MKIRLVILFAFATLLNFGQKDLTRNAVFSFAKFDTIHGRLQTDKIVFFKNNILDTLQSKLYLDSIVWCLNRYPTLIVQVFLSRNSEWGYAYQNSDSGIKQILSLADYLVNTRNVPADRIMALGSQCNIFLVSEDDLKNSKNIKNDKRIRTNFRILSKDYRPK